MLTRPDCEDWFAGGCDRLGGSGGSEGILLPGTRSQGFGVLADLAAFQGGQVVVSWWVVLTICSRSSRYEITKTCKTEAHNHNSSQECAGGQWTYVRSRVESRYSRTQSCFILCEEGGQDMLKFKHQHPARRTDGSISNLRFCPRKSSRNQERLLESQTPSRTPQIINLLTFDTCPRSLSGHRVYFPLHIPDLLSRYLLTSSVLPFLPYDTT